MTSYQSEWPASKSLQIINAGEDEQKRKPSYTAGGDVNGTATIENSIEGPLKN